MNSCLVLDPDGYIEGLEAMIPRSNQHTQHPGIGFYYYSPVKGIRAPWRNCNSRTAARIIQNEPETTCSARK